MFRFGGEVDVGTEEVYASRSVVVEQSEDVGIGVDAGIDVGRGPY